MDKVARLSAADRAALFGETAAGRGVANTIIEKDFWVCWTLRRVFSLPPGETASLVFKGGTSLSKAYDAIRRFPSLPPLPEYRVTPRKPHDRPGH